MDPMLTRRCPATHEESKVLTGEGCRSSWSADTDEIVLDSSPNVVARLTFGHDAAQQNAVNTELGIS